MSAHGQPSKGVVAVVLLCLLSSFVYFARPIADRKIATLPYSRTLYLISTGGRELER